MTGQQILDDNTRHAARVQTLELLTDLASGKEP